MVLLEFSAQLNSIHYQRIINGWYGSSDSEDFRVSDHQSLCVAAGLWLVMRQDVRNVDSAGPFIPNFLFTLLNIHRHSRCNSSVVEFLLSQYRLRPNALMFQA